MHLDIMQVTLPYPENINEVDKVLFDDILNYKVTTPKIKRLRNVFVSYEGLVLNHFVLNKRCAYNLIGNRDINFYWKYWKLILEQYLVCRFGKSLLSKRFSVKKKYTIVHTKWFNYGFWMNDAIHRCILIEEFNLKENITILLPEIYLQNHFVKETLSIFNFDIEVIPRDTHCFVSDFILPETREYTAFFDQPSIKKIRDKFVPIALEKTTITCFPNKIYLSRKERGVRSLVNESEVEELLESLGFTVLSFDNLSVWDQIAYMYHCTWFVSNHGAGFTNCMFMQSNGKVLEFLEYDFAHYGNPFPHWRLASLSSLNYFYLFGESKETQYITFVKNSRTTSEKRMGMVNRSIKIDIELLNKIVND